MSDRMKFTRIKGDYSTVRRLPRLGKIRLGLKVKNQAGKEYPTETEHFVCPEEVEAVYGEDPIELDVMLPSDNPEEVFVQKYAMYGAGAGLKCHGDGEQAERYNEQTKQWDVMACPCPFLKTDSNPKGTCTPQSHLMVMLPKVSMGGCYQITTRSFHATVGINSSLDLIRALAGRIALVPLKLRRVPTATQKDGKKATHYILNLILDASLPQIAELRQNPEHLLIPARYQIEGPQDINPASDPVDIEVQDHTEIDAAELADMSDEKMEDLRRKMDGGFGSKAQPAKSEEKAFEKTPEKQKEAPANDIRGNQRELQPGEWDLIVDAIDNNPDLRDIKEKVKTGMKIKSLNLIPAGQHEFLRRFREMAETAGYARQVRAILG